MTELYIISPENIEIDQFKIDLDKALSTRKVSVFQLRIKNTDHAQILKYAKELKPVCHKYGVNFIVNDYADIAKESGADGVHIGEMQDGDIEQVRKVIGDDKILGVSCYGSTDRAIEMCEKTADYVAFGAFYETTTKTPKARPKPDILQWWVRNCEIPCVAIGGIKHDNCKPLVEARADFIAVVSAIWNDPDGVKEAVNKLHDSINL